MNSHPRLPYPGLRAFTREESDLFFGRENCVDSMVDRLAETRFLAVLGPSGGGKSSLVRTGLLDALDLGLLAAAGSHWKIADMHPGGKPMRKLAAALLQLQQDDAPDDAEIDHLTEVLGQGPRSIVRWAASGNLPENSNLLILVDQFEELFRYGDYAQREEAEAFVSSLLESSASSQASIYVVITMRSEYLGACSSITGLAEHISAGLYLTPRMDREQCREAIVGPAGVVGFGIEPALVNRLLNDLSSFAPWDAMEDRDLAAQLAQQADQLPLMQHVLNRLWLRAQDEANEDPVELRLAEYEQIGGLSGALDAHGAEVIAGLGSERASAIESVFRALVSGTSVAAAVRRPCWLGELIELSSAHSEDVKAIVEAFSAPGCNFLRVSDTSLASDAVIVDISHESLIRQWTPLRQWLTNEARAAAAWRHLVTAEERYARGEGGLLTGLDLQNLAAWWDSIRPTAAWAQRNGGQFESVRHFLEQSRLAENQRSAAARALELRERNRLRRFVAGLGAAVVVFAALGLYVFVTKRQLATTNANLAIQKKNALIERDKRAQESTKLSGLLSSDEFRNVVGLEGLKARVMGIVAEYDTSSPDVGAQYAKARLLGESGEAQKAIGGYRTVYELGLKQIDSLPPGQAVPEALEVNFLTDAYYYCWFSMDIGEAEQGRQCLETMKRVAGPLQAEKAGPALLVAYSRLENLEARADAELEDEATPGSLSQLKKSVHDHTANAAKFARMAASGPSPTLEAMGVHFQFVRNLAVDETSETNKQNELQEACAQAVDMVRKNPLDKMAINAHVECLGDDAAALESSGVKAQSQKAANKTKESSKGKVDVSGDSSAQEAQKDFDGAEEKLQTALGGIDYMLGMYPGNTDLLLHRVDVEIALADLWRKLLQNDKAETSDLRAKEDFVKALTARTLFQSQTYQVKNLYTSLNTVNFQKKNAVAIQFYRDIANAVAANHAAFPKAKSFTYVADSAADNLGYYLSEDPASRTEALKYLSGTIDRLNKQGVMRSLGQYSESFDTYCRTYGMRLRLYAAAKDTDRMMSDLKEMKRACLPVLEKYPWDIYVRDPFVTARSRAGQTLFQQKRYQEALPELEYASHWVDADASLTLSHMYNEGLGVMRNGERAQELENIAPGQHLTRFTVPADFGGAKSPFDIYIRDWPTDYPFEGIDDQVIWLKKARGGTISPEIVESFHKLMKIAKDNKVSFRELTVYALGQAAKDQPNNTAAEKSFNADATSFKGAYTPQNLVTLKKSAGALYEERVTEKQPEAADKLDLELINDAEDLMRESPVTASYRVASDIYLDAGDHQRAKDKTTAEKYFIR